MKNRYSRNRLYISDTNQKLIKNFPIIIGGAGIGSIISECMLRFGFENLTIIDGDKVELSNLNRQNYLEEDIGAPKVEALQKRLLAINSNAKIRVYNDFLTTENLDNYMGRYELAVNALDFSTDVALQFDDFYNKSNIPILHPYNIGWGALVAVIDSEQCSLRQLEKAGNPVNELQVVEYATSYMRYWHQPQKWIEEVIAKYKSEPVKYPIPQLSIASWKLAGMCTEIAYQVAIQRKVKTFPEFYLSKVIGN